MKLKRFFSSLLVLILLISASMILSSIPGTAAQAAPAIKLNKTNIYLSDYSDRGFYGYRLSVLNTKSKVSWKSNNTKVATIDKKGWVAAVSEGSTTVTATVGTTKLTCKVNVINLGLYLSENSVTMFKSDSYPIYLSGNVKGATWTSSNKKVVTVKKDHNNQCTLTAKGVGTATVKVLVNKKWTLFCKVTIKKKEKIKIDQECTINGPNALVKSTNLSPVDALVVIKVLFYTTEEDYQNGKSDYEQSDCKVIQAGQTTVTKFTNSDFYENIEDAYKRYTVTYEILPTEYLLDIEHKSDGLKVSDIKSKVVGSTKNEIEVYLHSDEINEVCTVNVEAVYYKDGKMIDMQEDLLAIILPTRKNTIKIQTAQYSFYDRLKYDDVKIYVNKIDIPNK